MTTFTNKVNHLINFTKKIILGFFVFGVIPTNAASYYFQPSTNTFSQCRNSIDLIINASGESSNSADIEIFYDPTKINIIDRDGSASGIQIEEGDAFTRYWGNITFPSTGQIFLAGGSLPNNTINLTDEQVFATIHFDFIGNPGDVVTFTIRMDSIGATLDSNIANTINGGDLLISKTDGVYTFHTPQNCRNNRGGGSEIETFFDEIILPIGTQTPVSSPIEPSPLPTIVEGLDIKQAEEESRSNSFLRFNSPFRPLEINNVEYGVYISNFWILSCVFLQVGLILFLIMRRRKIKKDISFESVLIMLTSKYIKKSNFKI